MSDTAETGLEHSFQEKVSVVDSQQTANTVVQYAYHVTNVEKDTKLQPEWTKLKYGIADDPSYDGPLVGLPCVFFTTTLYNNELPPMSMYPRDGIQGKNYWRVKIPLTEFADYQIYFCYENQPPMRAKQVRLVLAKGSLADSLDRTSWWKDNKQKALQYLRREPDGTWYSNLYKNDEGQNTFVNFVIFGDVAIKDDAVWDGVTHVNMPGNPNKNAVGEALVKAMANDFPKRDEFASHLTTAMLYDLTKGEYQP